MFHGDPVAEGRDSQAVHRGCFPLTVRIEERQGYGTRIAGARGDDPETSARLRPAGRTKNRRLDRVTARLTVRWGMHGSRCPGHGHTVQQDACLGGEQRNRRDPLDKRASGAAPAELEITDRHPVHAINMSRMVGRVTASVLLAVGGDPKEYGSAKAYRKVFGLNLKERSSGTKQGQLHLTKRGSGLARAYLYMSALRYIHRDPVVRSWYAKKVARQGGHAKMKAVTAIMRKLVMAVFHVAHGHPFDARKLFDLSRLELSADGL